jgi:hypothetical protein
MNDQQQPPGWERPPPPGQPLPDPAPGRWGPPPPGGRGPPPQPPQQSAGAGRVLLGVLLGVLVGFIAPFLPGFLYAVLTGQDLDLPAAVLGLLLLIAVPLGRVLGGLRAARKTKR